MAGDEVYIVNSEYNFFDKEDVECINNKLDELNQWIDENPQINAKKCNARNLCFLRSCRFDSETTKIKLERFYTLRAIRKEWFWNRNPFSEEIQEILNVGVFLPLPEKDEGNRTVIIIRTAAHDPKIHTQNLVLKVSQMILDILIYIEPEVATLGITAIFDMNGFSLRHCLQMTPMHIRRSMDSWSLYPSRLKKLEFVNVSAPVNFVLNSFKYFLTPKMKSRMSICKTTSQIGCELPKELGGKGESYSELAQKWKNIVEKNAAFFADDDKYKSLC